MAVTADADDLRSFLDKWRAQWPGWDVVQVFVPLSERDMAMAWFALLEEWRQAALGGDDPAPGLAKLAWWQEELRGWARGARRHPLGTALQRQLVDWAGLADGLSVWRHRDRLQDDARTFAEAIMPFAQAAATAESALWPGREVSTSDMSTWLLAQAVLHGQSTAVADEVLMHWPGAGRASAARRQWAALQHSALRGLHATSPRRGRLQALRCLWSGWRAARNAALPGSGQGGGVRIDTMRGS